jgi:hypothetical protein
MGVDSLTLSEIDDFERMDETSTNHVELMINEVSDYITVSDLSPSTGTAEDRPALGTYQLVGGNNGLSGVTDSD